MTVEEIAQALAEADHWQIHGRIPHHDDNIVRLTVEFADATMHFDTRSGRLAMVDAVGQARKWLNYQMGRDESLLPNPEEVQ